MATYAMLTRLSPEALTRPEAVAELNRQVEDRIKQTCPEVKWLANYAVLGPYDYLDIFEAPDSDTATKVTLLVRSFGHATTETWVVTPWERFINLAQGLHELEKRAGDVLSWIAAGQLKLRMELTFPLSEAAEARQRLEGRKTTGKILLIPSDTSTP